MNTRLILQFDGTNYHGFQRQNNAVTIQSEVERAISNVFKKEIAITGCSRTDSGVHSLNFCCNFHHEHSIDCEKLPIAINTHLPKDIRIVKADIVDEDFHSRYSVTSKTYLYKVWNGKILNPFYRNYAYHFPYKLDFSAIDRAMGDFLGTHDFTAFMASGGGQHTTVRTIHSLTYEKHGDLIEFKINANAYLYNMVRIIIGTLLYIGINRIERDSVPEIIKSLDRKNAGITVGAEGLYLLEVFYD